MNRTDRLVALVMLLQSRRVITAAEMAVCHMLMIKPGHA